MDDVSAAVRRASHDSRGEHSSRARDSLVYAKKHVGRAVASGSKTLARALIDDRLCMQQTRRPGHSSTCILQSALSYVSCVISPVLVPQRERVSEDTTDCS